MFCSNILDKLLNEDRFTYTGTTEQTNLTTLGIWGKKIDNLNSCFKNFNSRLLFFKRRWISVNYPVFCILQAFATIYCIPKNIKQSSQCTVTNRNFNTASCCGNFTVSLKSFTGT